MTKWAAGLVTVTAAIELAKAGFSAVIGFLTDSVKAAAGAEAAQAQLTATMASHGVAVPEVIAAYQGYISALAKTTTQSDDALTASAALLTTMGVMPREMNAALTAATNLAERFGGGEAGLAKATEAVGKAAMGQTTALAKAGIQLDDTKVKAEGFSLRRHAGQRAARRRRRRRGQYLCRPARATRERVGRGAGIRRPGDRPEPDRHHDDQRALERLNRRQRRPRGEPQYHAAGLGRHDPAGQGGGPARGHVRRGRRRRSARRSRNLRPSPTAPRKVVGAMLTIEKGLLAIGSGSEEAVRNLEALKAHHEADAAAMLGHAESADTLIGFTKGLSEEASRLGQQLKISKGQDGAAHRGDESERERARI